MSLLGWFRKAQPALTSYDDDGALAVLVAAPDAARADSAVLAEAVARGVDLDQRLLVRHHLVLPGDAVERAAVVLAQDGYQLTVVGGGLVRAWRTQVLTAMGAAQERSRMAGLAQRLGGDVLGWDACGPSGTVPAG